MTAPILIACSHGSSEETARRVVRELVDAVCAATGVEVRQAFADVEEPRVAQVVAGIDPDEAGTSAVVVPLLLAGGYHVHHDIAKAIASRPDVLAAPALGPDPRLVGIVLDRLRGAGVSPQAHVVLAAAGSSDARSRAETDIAVEELHAVWEGPVTLGFAAGVTPSVADAVAEARFLGASSVAVASFLLAPGYFQRKIEASGADSVTAPLAPDPRLVSIIAERYRDALKP